MQYLRYNVQCLEIEGLWSALSGFLKPHNMRLDHICTSEVQDWPSRIQNFSMRLHAEEHHQAGLAGGRADCL